ncbi:2'-5' RNA ligase family protein [Candidatus Woesearchaeota archaeon]|nr:2'-5' RNA ligase family protein [Candidatus Woesearchaeota archaeon]
MTYVIALLPDKKLHDRMLAAKARAQKIAGKVEGQYLTDIPHITLLVGEYKQGVVTALATKAGLWKNMLQGKNITISSWIVFSSDPITGKETLACTFSDKSKSLLRKMQQSVLTTVQPYKKKGIPGRYADVFERMSPKLQQNVRKYGYPFIGKGWIPHVTVGSFSKSTWKPVWGALDDKCPKGDYDIGSLGIYLLTKNDKMQEKKIFLLNR